MKSFKRFLSEEDQEVPDSYGFWFFLAYSRFGAPFPNSYGSLGALSTWGGSFFQKMYGLPRAMLDIFDYNGDGLIGYNDQVLIREIAEIAIQIYEETGDLPPVITAADYLQNWEYYSELYGVEFPDPNGYAGYPGNPDSNYRDETNPSNLSADTIYGWVGGFNFWSELNEALSTEQLVGIYGQDLMNQIFAVYDLDGDGRITGTALTAGGGGDGEVWQMLYVLVLQLGLNISVDKMPSPSELKDMFNNFSMLSDKTLADLFYERYGEYPEGDYQYYDPTYGQNQAPPPPEETPQSQAPPPEIGMA